VISRISQCATESHVLTKPSYPGRPLADLFQHLENNPAFLVNAATQRQAEMMTAPLLARPVRVPSHSSFAAHARAWRARQPHRSRDGWIWGHPKYRPGLTLRQRRRLLQAAHEYNDRHRRPGQHGGPLTNTGPKVLRALLDIQNSVTGECFPSYDAIAARAKVSRSTVGEAIKRLERAGFLQIVNRRIRGRRRDGRILPCVTSNAYLFKALPSETENLAGTGFPDSKRERPSPNYAASPWSGDLRSPAASAATARPRPPRRKSVPG
jgi:DNA-binding MarR family transcriptional regulator